MYRIPNNDQLDIYDFILPFGGHLKEDNRWVKLRKMINWEVIRDVYGSKFENQDAGREAFLGDVAFGALYIQRKLGFTDRELVEQIAENPYMQYFIGFKEYRNEKPFDPSLLVSFRKRLPESVMSEILEKMFIEPCGLKDTQESTAGKADATKNKDDSGNKDGNDSDRNDGNSSGGTDNRSDGTDGSCGGAGGKEASDGSVSAVSDKEKVPANKGTLIIDATCTPADIAYPTDLELCDKARQWTEVILDRFWTLYGPLEGKNEKPRTYRKTARRRFLNLVKRRIKSRRKIRKEIRYQLSCINRNLGYISEYEKAHGSAGLRTIEKERLATIRTFYTQQKEMLDNRTHSVPDRIVNLAQPWVRPIVRGKAKSPTEFGAKVSISVINGYTFVDRISFDAYNEGEANEFIRVVENYRKRFGRYPERILADKLYRSRANRAFCKENGIRISGPRLGRPGKDHADELRQELKEIGERNAVEGKFGNGKRKLGMSRIMAKLKETTGTMIMMDIFVLNMEQLFRQGVLFSYRFLVTTVFQLLTGLQINQLQPQLL